MADISQIQNGEALNLSSKLSLAAKLSMPAIMAQLSSILMQYIDASMVGRLGADCSASVGLMSSSLWFFWGICSMVTMGFSVQVAHRLGAKEQSQARSVVRQGITSCLLFAVFASVAGLLLAPKLPEWLGGEDVLRHDASLYFSVFIAALPLLTMNYLGGGMLRCAGNMKDRKSVV